MSQQVRLNRVVVLVFGLLLGTPVFSAPVRADSTGRQIGNFLSGSGNLIYLGVGTVLPLLEDHKQGTGHTLRIIDSALTSEENFLYVEDSARGIVFVFQVKDHGLASIGSVTGLPTTLQGIAAQ